MQEHRDHGTISMRKFYARRGVRLLPSALLCIAAFLDRLCAIFDRERFVWMLQDAAAAVTYIYNLVFPVGLVFVDPVSAAHRSIDQFWSLAVEEQFYLVIAVTVLVCIRRRWMKQLAIGLAVVAVFISWQRFTGNTGPWPGGPNNDSLVSRGLSLLWLSRYDSLMWGVGLAVINAHLPDPLPTIWRRWLPRVGAVGSRDRVGHDAARVGIPQRDGRQGRACPTRTFRWRRRSPPGSASTATYWIKFGYTVTAISFAPAMLAMARIPEWWANRALSWKPLRFLGRMSYTVYVWHTFVYFVLLDLLGLDSVLGQKWRAPILAAVAIVACLPIFYGVERRMLRVKLRFANEKEVLDLNTGKMVSIDDERVGPTGERRRPARRDRAPPSDESDREPRSPAR